MCGDPIAGSTFVAFRSYARDAGANCIAESAARRADSATHLGINEMFISFLYHAIAVSKRIEPLRTNEMPL